MLLDLLAKLKNALEAHKNAAAEVVQIAEDVAAFATTGNPIPVAEDAVKLVETLSTEGEAKSE